MPLRCTVYNISLSLNTQGGTHTCRYHTCRYNICLVVKTLVKQPFACLLAYHLNTHRTNSSFTDSAYWLPVPLQRVTTVHLTWAGIEPRLAPKVENLTSAMHILSILFPHSTVIWKGEQNALVLTFNDSNIFIFFGFPTGSPHDDLHCTSNTDVWILNFLFW